MRNVTIESEFKYSKYTQPGILQFTHLTFKKIAIKWILKSQNVIVLIVN